MTIAETVKRLFGRPRRERMTLPQLVTLLADQPTTENRNAFYRSLLLSKVGCQIPNPDGSIKPGTRVPTEDDNLRLPTGTLPDGRRMLLVCCDIPGMFAAHPATYAEFEGRAALEFARDAGLGLLVQNKLDGRDSWAVVPSEHVAVLLGVTHT